MINVSEKSLITLELHMQLLFKTNKNEKHFLNKFLCNVPKEHRKKIRSDFYQSCIQDSLEEYPLASIIHRTLHTERSKKFSQSKTLKRMNPSRGIYGVRAADIKEYTRSISTENISYEFYYRLCKAYVVAQYYNFIAYEQSIPFSGFYKFKSYYSNSWKEDGTLLNDSLQESVISDVVRHSVRASRFPDKEINSKTCKYPIFSNIKKLTLNIQKNIF
jgi:hypothetical protein